MLAMFRFIDLEFTFQVVLSLFAILFSYDAVCGERERGTLEIERTREGRSPVTRAGRIRLRNISREEAAIGQRAHKVSEAIREEGSLVFAETLGNVEKDLEKIARATLDDLENQNG